MYFQPEFRMLKFSRLKVEKSCFNIHKDQTAFDFTCMILFTKKKRKSVHFLLLLAQFNRTNVGTQFQVNKKDSWELSFWLTKGSSESYFWLHNTYRRFYYYIGLKWKCFSSKLVKKDGRNPFNQSFLEYCKAKLYFFIFYLNMRFYSNSNHKQNQILSKQGFLKSRIQFVKINKQNTEYVKS